MKVYGQYCPIARTLEVVVSVLAGAINTRLVAAVRAAGGKPVGLTGVDAAVVTVRRAGAMVSVAGSKVDLGLVGAPTDNGTPRLVSELLQRGYVPVIACIGATNAGQLLNVNADTLAAHVAAGIGARELMLVGGTAGVLDGAGQTIAALSSGEADALMQDGTASAGMIAKLRAALTARSRGVGQVAIVDGRSAASIAERRGTQVV